MVKLALAASAVVAALVLVLAVAILSHIAKALEELGSTVGSLRRDSRERLNDGRRMLETLDRLELAIRHPRRP